MRRRLAFPRDVLLIEIERRCRAERCNARAWVGLTKDEARAYTGFRCGRCECWNDDALSERDIPEWWEELKITALEGLRPPRSAEGGGGADDEPGEVIRRLSDAWRDERRRRRREGSGNHPGVDDEAGRGVVDESAVDHLLGGEVPL